jgi:hypothetical protein
MPFAVWVMLYVMVNTVFACVSLVFAYRAHKSIALLTEEMRRLQEKYTWRALHGVGAAHAPEPD